MGNHGMVLNNMYIKIVSKIKQKNTGTCGIYICIYIYISISYAFHISYFLYLYFLLKVNIFFIILYILI